MIRQIKHKKQEIKNMLRTLQAFEPKKLRSSEGFIEF